jgi:ssRNA-specific RNase YbeY (16S rRNA maturation enzyme)
VHDPLRSHGGNWTTQGMHRSGYDHAEFECQKAMADFMTEMHERFDIVE